MSFKFGHIKKRTVTALILTLLSLILTKQYWLIFKPMRVSFDIKGEQVYVIEVQLDKKDKFQFKKVKNGFNTADCTKNSHVTFNIKKAKIAKGFRIILSDFENTDLLKISNIELQDGRFKLDKLNKFEATGALVKVSDNALVVYPQNNIVTLTYKEPIKIINRPDFDFRIFVIVITVVFLFSLKISNYVADFNSVQGKSKWDVIFLGIFFVFLIIPGIKINQSQKSINENRFLKEWQPIIKENNEINYNFGKDFEGWFNDRFNGRKFFTGAYSNLLLFLEGKNPSGVLDKKSGFMYNTWEFNYIEKETVEKSFKALEELDKFLKENNIELYVYITPPKPEIYNIKGFSEAKRKKLHAEFLKLTEELKNKNISVVYLYDAISKASKDNLMFYKTEHHWTDDAAFVGYGELMKEINKKHPDIVPLKESDFNYSYNKSVRGDFDRLFHNGTTAVALNVNNLKKYHNIEYKYYTHKNYTNLRKKIIANNNARLEKIFYYPEGADYRVILIGTSQNESLCEFIPFTFKYTKRIRNTGVADIPEEDYFKIIKYYKDEILSYKTNILILGITYNDIPQLVDIFNMN